MGIRYLPCHYCRNDTPYCERNCYYYASYKNSKVKGKKYEPLCSSCWNGLSLRGCNAKVKFNFETCEVESCEEYERIIVHILKKIKSMILKKDK